MLLPLDLHPNAIDDLEAIRKRDPESWCKLAALIQQLKVDNQLQERMLNHDDAEDTDIGRVNFQKWSAQFGQGNHLWRVKVYEMDRDVQAMPYRLIYAFHPWSQNAPKVYFQILAIAHRSFKYETGTEFAQRIIDDYRELLDLF